MEWLITAITSAALTLFGVFVILRKLGNEIGVALQNLFKPQVKRAMSIIGSQGGDAKAQKELTNKMAQQFITQNYGMIKIAAEKFLGVNVDELIQEYGALNILQAMRQLLPALGIKDLGSLAGQITSGASASGETPKFKL